MLGVSVEQASLGRPPRRWRTRGGCCALALEVGEDLLDHYRLFDAGDDLDWAAAALAGPDVDVEDPLQALCLRLMAARR